MASPHVLNAINKYAELYQWMYRIAVEYDANRQKLVYVETNKTLIIWKYIFRASVILGTASIVFITLKPLYIETKDFPPWKILLMATLGLLGGLTSFIEFAISVYGLDMVYVWNSVMNLAMENLKRKGSYIKKFQLARTGSNIDLLGTLMMTYFCSLPFVAVMVALFGVYENIDPFCFVIREFTPLKTNNTVVITLRLLLTFACAIEMTRMYCVLVILCIVPITVINNLVVSLLMIHNRLQHHTVLNVWKKLWILNEIWRPSTSRLMSATLGLCLLMAVIVNFATIKLSTVISMPVFFMFPYLSIVLPIVFTSVISHTSMFYEKSSKLLGELKRTSRSRWDLKNKKYQKKFLKSLRPFSIDVGINGFRLFISKRSLKLNYSSAVISYTITAFISIPGDKLL